MNDKPALSILIPWCERDELRLTLAANAPAFRGHDAEVLIINCGGSGQRLRDIISASEVTCVRQLDLSIPRFNRSLALNVGLSRARSDTIFVSDADVVLLSDLPVEAMDERSFVTIEWVYESEAIEMKEPADRSDSAVTLANTPTLELNFRDGSRVRHQLSGRDRFGNRRAVAGLLLAKKRDLLNIQGYNSDLETWGWEDNDVIVRLQYVLGLQRVLSGTALHLTHGDIRRALSGSRSQSNRRNLISCCRNYNNGLFLGSYHADIANLADKVTETFVDVVAPKVPGAIVQHAGQRSPFLISGPKDCGDENGTMRESGGKWSKLPPSVGELLIEAALRKSPLENFNILHVGIGASRMATQLSSRCRHITGVTLNESERSLAVNLCLQNYDVAMCNKYSEGFRGHLPLSAYDMIIDHNLARHTCCQRHLMALMENYSCVLAPTGSLVTAEHGIDGSPTDSCCKLSEADLESLAEQFNLCVTRAGCGVFSLARRIRIHSCAGTLV
jgi:N-terminal domain of galactosyltransferase